MATLELPPNVEPAHARLVLALGLFQEEDVTIGQAAEIAGLSYRAFRDELRKRGIPVIVYDDEAFEQDMAFLQAFKEDRGL